MFGYATNETEVLMPAPITYSHRLVEQQAFIRKSGKLNWLDLMLKVKLALFMAMTGNLNLYQQWCSQHNMTQKFLKKI
ncbi:MAG: hypothetical protein Ct9H300mP3_00980 [Gammaproteobacteria bacterium]|nr:MAG: hypothetical protein Ct9H300mP3_00980 [Gammaproteobacteria bacterium]